MWTIITNCLCEKYVHHSFEIASNKEPIQQVVLTSVSFLFRGSEMHSPGKAEVLRKVSFGKTDCKVYYFLWHIYCLYKWILREVLQINELMWGHMF